MRFLGIGEYCDLGAMYYQLQEAGHEVRVFVDYQDYRSVYRGLLQFTENWQAELGWIRQAGDDGIIVFESAIKGELQDALRREGFRVIGGSAFGDRLEDDRQFGQQIMQEMGLHIARSYEFHSYDAAIGFLQQSPGRYVYKNNGANSLRTRNYIGVLEDGADIVTLLELYRQHAEEESSTEPPSFVLMEHIQGIEIGVGAYFNGEQFLSPACLDWEHKRFFPGDLGELTGEMGTIVTYRGAETLFNKTLAHLQDRLRESGYCGYINLNMMVNDSGIWPLEFTSRFGYPGFAICAALHQESWDVIFRRMLNKSGTTFTTRDGFSAGIVLTVPSFPYSYGYEDLSLGAPILLHPDMTAEEKSRLHFAEVEKTRGHLHASGMTGYLGVATGIGANVEEARDQAYALAPKVIVPNIRYRMDIGLRLIQGELRQLQQWGYLPED